MRSIRTHERTNEMYDDQAKDKRKTGSTGSAAQEVTQDKDHQR